MINHCVPPQLVELLGYSQLELVQELLMNRTVIVDKILSESKSSDSLLIATGRVCVLDLFCINVIVMAVFK